MSGHLVTPQGDTWNQPCSKAPILGIRLWNCEEWSWTRMRQGRCPGYTTWDGPHSQGGPSAGVVPEGDAFLKLHTWIPRSPHWSQALVRIGEKVSQLGTVVPQCSWGKGCMVWGQVGDLGSWDQTSMTAAPRQECWEHAPMGPTVEEDKRNTERWIQATPTLLLLRLPGETPQSITVKIRWY